MPRSSRHKSHKQSKHNLKEYSDSEEDAKMKEKSSKDENLVRAHRALTSGEKRKLSSQIREIKDGRDLNGHGNGEVSEEYVSSKRRKQKAGIGVVIDRWNEGGEDKGDTEKNGEKEVNIGEILKVDSTLKESIRKGGSLRIELKNKSNRFESGSVGGRKEESLAPMVVEKEESKGKGESKRKSEKDSSGRKEGIESKDKDRRSEKEKNGGQERKVGDTELVDMNVGKKQGSQSGNFSAERQGKSARGNTERPVQDELHNPEVQKEIEKRIHRRRDGSSERDKHYYDFKDGEERLLSSRGDFSKDVKCRDDKQKDGNYTDKYEEDCHKDDKKRDAKYRKEPDKDNKHRNEKHREDSVKDARRRDDRHRKDGDRDNRRKDEEHHEDGERDSRRKDGKYQEGTERDGPHWNDKHLENGERGRRRKDDRYHEDGDKDVRRSDERFYEDGERDDRHRDNNYGEHGDRDNRHMEDIERDNRREESKQGDELDKDKRLRDTKYKDERASRDQSGEKSDPKRSRDNGYTDDHHSKKSNAYDDSITRDDRTARCRDDQGKSRTIEKEDYGDNRSRSTKGQIFDTEKKSLSSARMDPGTGKGRFTQKNADLEFTYSHSRRRSSSTSNSYAPRDTYRILKQDESKYRDYNLEERVWHNLTSSRDYAGAVGGTEKTSSSWSLEKFGQKDGHLGELPAEKCLKPDIGAPLQLVDKSPSSSTDRRQLSRSGARRSIDVEVSTQRSGGSRDAEYSCKEARGSQELAIDVLTGDDLSQADADASSVSSPFLRNNRFSSSKSFLPPLLFRTGMDSPSMLGFSQDDSIGKLNSRHRRIGDPNMGRIQGNAWRGVPSWPSPVANGFLPFPHVPSFHSVVQPFPAPPMFGVRPSMELSHPAPYHMPDAGRFSGCGRPIGWRNQVNDSCPPLPAWDASSAVFGDESHIYRRPDWDHSRNLPGGRGWESSENLWKGINRTASLEMPSSEKENNSAQSADGALADQSFQPAQNDQIRIDQQSESTDISQAKSFEKNDFEAPLSNLEETSDVSKMSRKDDVRLCHVYLSKLDISADLAEPELYNQCTGVIDMDQSILSDVDNSKVLYMEEAVEAKTASTHKILSYTLFAAVDDSVFQKAMFLYRRQRGNFRTEHEEVEILNQFIPNSDNEDSNVKECDTEKLCSTDDMQGAKNALSNFETEVHPLLSAESFEGSDVPLPSEVKVVSVNSTRKNEEPKLLDTKCGPLLNSDVSPEAIMPESIVSGSINLSRIQISPESTH